MSLRITHVQQEDGLAGIELRFQFAGVDFAGHGLSVIVTRTVRTTLLRSRRKLLPNVSFHSRSWSLACRVGAAWPAFARAPRVRANRDSRRTTTIRSRDAGPHRAIGDRLRPRPT